MNLVNVSDIDKLMKLFYICNCSLLVYKKFKKNCKIQKQIYYGK